MALVHTTVGLSFEGEAGRSIVDAALTAGLFFPYSCKTGRCQTCKCQLISGETRLISDELGLSEEEVSKGWILGCVREALSEITIHAAGVSKFAMPKAKTLPCRITSMKLLNEDVMLVVLRLPPNSEMTYYAGQYIEVIKSDVRRSYSIANAPREDGLIELHIKRFQGGQLSQYWFEQAKVGDLLRLNGPFGTFFVKDCANKNLIFLATGTGFAPVKAMLESLADLESNLRPASVRFYWGGRKKSDFYMSPS